VVAAAEEFCWELFSATDVAYAALLVAFGEVGLAYAAAVVSAALVTVGWVSFLRYSCAVLSYLAWVA
jgi:hypothetical protein